MSILSITCFEAFKSDEFYGIDEKRLILEMKVKIEKKYLIKENLKS